MSSGVKAVLQHSGLPLSWLKRPKLPSRNWLIFIAFSSSLTSLYFYDRSQAKRIRQEYILRVSHLAQLPSGPTDLPRKVTVYGAKWPGDEDVDQSLKYFRRYVKPILVAAAIDYDMVKVKRQGELAQLVADKIKANRRLDAGIEHVPEALSLHPMAQSPQERRTHELQGGIILVGRPTFKEFMDGLKRGWTESYHKFDTDQMLANELEADGRFDEPPDTEEVDNASPSLPPPTFNPFLKPTPSNQPPLPPSDPPPPTIPTLPPLLLVPFTNYIGLSQIPLMLWGFFNERHKVRAGCQAAYRLVMINSRPITLPTFTTPSIDDGQGPSSKQGGDLDFDIKAESYYKTSLKSIPEETEKYRTKYYDELPKRLETARAIARGLREMTKEEVAHPPPTEVELRAERMNKEKRWRGDVQGWNIVKPDQPVTWDARFQEALCIFIDPVDPTQAE